MRVRIENLGPIREAELDLTKPLVVLTGPNNTGKTYLAWAVYSLGRMGTVEPPKSALEWVERLLAAEGQRLPRESLSEIRTDVMDAIAESFLQRLPRDFAAPRSRFSDTRIELIPSATYEYGRWHTSIRTGPHSLTLQTNGEIIWLELEGAQDTSSVTLSSEHKRALAGRASIHIKLDTIESKLFVLPVERLAINLFARELAARRTELVDDLLEDELATNGSKLQERATLYPLAIREALQSAIRAPPSFMAGVFADLAEALEKSVLGGSIVSTADDELEFVPRGASNVSLRLHQTASVVKSLVSLVVYLRNHAHPGQRLIIDEPELNLHPDNQRRVARVLARAVNRGLKVMMSTHSDYMVRELNNLIMLGQDSDDARQLATELKYDPSEILRPEQLGVYLVNDGQCRPLPVTETGFEVATIDEEIHRLNRDAQTIYQRLFCD